MIENVSIRNWQALRKVDLDLDRFTVIVGASSSGKSGLMRAFRAIASNVRGTNSITRGQKSCAITVKTGDTVIALERGEGSGSYKILHEGQMATYTKLAGGVPEQITNALRIAPVPTGGTSINFAGQFDKPYLLDESGANVARELGELTKVNIIFEAVRTANKKRAAASAALKTRQADLDALNTKLTAFIDLPQKLLAADTAEATAQRAAELHDRVNRLARAIDQLRLAEQVLSKARVPELPDIDGLLTIRKRREVFRRLVSDLAQVEGVITDAEQQAIRWEAEESTLGVKLTDTLRSAGKCPTCGQLVH